MYVTWGGAGKQGFAAVAERQTRRPGRMAAGEKRKDRS